MAGKGHMSAYDSPALRLPSHRRLSSRMGAYFYLAPALLVIGIFVIYPAVNLFILSLCKASIIGRTRFIGVDNFAALFASRDFLASLKATAIFMVSVVIIQTLIALSVAILAESESRIDGPREDGRSSSRSSFPSS